MRPITPLVLAVASLTTACSSDGDPPAIAVATTGAPVPADVSVAPTSTAPGTSTGGAGDLADGTSPPQPVVPLAANAGYVIEITGAEEVVFDWTTDQCQPEHIPDIAARAFRTPDGQVNLLVSHWSAWRMVGPSLDDLTSDCSATLLDSDFDPEPAAYDDAEWLAAVYTIDGQTYHGIVHNEYRGDTHSAARPGQCPSGERLPCLDVSFTQVVSVDGGRTFQHAAPPPGHLVATLPYTYRDDTVPSGIRQPSNIVDGRDGYWYLFGNVSDQPDQEQWVCAMRTDDLADPKAWRYWDGDGFDGVWGDPYRDPTLGDDQKCAPYAFDAIGNSLNEGIVFDESIGRFVMVGVGFAPEGRDPAWGIYAATSADLSTWSTRERLLELPLTPTVVDDANDLFYAYPALIDPDSTSPNFETSDGSAYLYMTRINAGGNSLDRDLVRWPVAISPVPAPVPDWTFDGDDGGWVADNDLAPLSVVDGLLTTSSTGADPWMLSPQLRLDARPARAVVRMRASGGAGVNAVGQLFWSVEGDERFVEARSITFTVELDGEWRDHSLDLSSVPGWTGTVTGFRLDPLDGTDRSIAIDRITIAAI
jgi:hypothetical protein